jgi:hypothetical protein
MGDSRFRPVTQVVAPLTARMETGSHSTDVLPALTAAVTVVIKAIRPNAGVEPACPSAPRGRFRSYRRPALITSPTPRYPGCKTKNGVALLTDLPTPGGGNLHPDDRFRSANDVLLMGRQQAVDRQFGEHVIREMVCEHERLGAPVLAARQEPQRAALFVGKVRHGDACPKRGAMRIAR